MISSHARGQMVYRGSSKICQSTRSAYSRRRSVWLLQAPQGDGCGRKEDFYSQYIRDEEVRLLRDIGLIRERWVRRFHKLLAVALAIIQPHACPHAVVELADDHGCTLFDFLVEVRGNNCGSSVDFRGCCQGLPWKSVGFHGKGQGSWRFHSKGHGSWRFHGKCYGCGHGTCRGSVRGKLCGTNHGNPRKSAAIATVISADVKPQQNKHDRPGELSRQSSDTRQLPRKSTAVTTAIYTAVRGHPRQLSCHVNRR